MKALLIVVLCLIMILGGCVANKKSDPAPSLQLEKWRLLADRSFSDTTDVSEKSRSDDQREATENPTLPESETDPGLADTHVPLPMVPVPVRKLPDMPVTMHMNNVSVPVLLRTLAKIAELNMMINDSITGQTQLVVTESPWDQVFLGLMDAYGLAYEWAGDILQVFSAADFKNGSRFWRPETLMKMPKLSRNWPGSSWYIRNGGRNR